MPYRRKLIEVALPLEAINVASAREKSIRHGHPSTLHLWWARRPLATCRAVLFASLVDDPSSLPEQFPTNEAQEEERQRLFRIIEALVKWENSTNETVLEAARAEIRKSTGGNPPPVLDPFCGGGSIPLEAQRLGLEVHASDLNPVAVLITKALIEIPPKFAGMSPVNSEDQRRSTGAAWKGAAGLAADVRYYGKWMRDEAERRIGHLYPKVRLPKEQGGGEATVIAWLWARTVTCPNPACGARMPLIRSFWLSKMKGQNAWIEPIVDREAKAVRFEVRRGQGLPAEAPKIGRGAKFRCLVCGHSSEDQHIKSEARAGRMSAQLMAIVAEGQRGRIYLPPQSEHETLAASVEPGWKPEQPLVDDSRAIWCFGYGLDTFDKLFTPRQLVALATFSDLVGEARERVRRDATAQGIPNDNQALRDGGIGVSGYGEAVATYLAIVADRLANYSSSLCTWHVGGPTTGTKSRDTFSRQGLPMTWDYAEVNPFSTQSGSFANSLDYTVEAVVPLGLGVREALALQADATASTLGMPSLLSTDPPYYDNIGYADLSDFFYVWLRRSLGGIYPTLFSTLVTPKAQELVASPYRFEGSKKKAQQFFEQGLRQAFERMRAAQHPDYPLTVYYAFRQAESEGADNGHGDGKPTIASTGWETMLEGLLGAGFQISGTWPMRSELSNRMVATGTNALASSIILVCRPRSADAPMATRREFVSTLKRELPEALRLLQHGNIAPVDLAQAAIGPGMAVFSRYTKVLEPDGSMLRVRTALQIINQALDEVLVEQEGEYDAPTRWAVAWYEQAGMEEGAYGTAETLSKAKNTSVGGMVETGIVQARGGKVRFLRRDELLERGAGASEQPTAWDVTQRLIRALDQQGEIGAAELLARVGADGDLARDLAYRLYTTSERKGWTQEALAYNSLVVAWPEITRLAGGLAGAERQGRMLEG